MTSLSNHSYPPPTHDEPYGGIIVERPPTHDFHDDRTIVRTPSPTPSEERALKGNVIDYKQMLNWRYWFRREWFWYYVVGILVVVLSALVTIYHEQIVEWLTPVSQFLHKFKLGWLVPVGILFVISFPPLFGHEVVAVLCGVVWGLWIGFAIVALGTFLGEIGNFYAFKYLFRKRAEKLEREKLMYACLAKAVREGGFKIALAARLSAIPGHFTTAVFSTCGMNIIVFSCAAILSLPKQFLTVYLGVILHESGSGAQPSSQSKAVTDSVLVVTLLITAFAMWYILHEMNKVKPAIIMKRRQDRKLKKMQELGLDISRFASTEFSPTPTIRQSEPDAELKAATFNAVSLYQPKPTKPNVLHKARRDEQGYAYPTTLDGRGMPVSRRSTNESVQNSGPGPINTSYAPGMHHPNFPSEDDLGYLSSRPPMQHAPQPDRIPRGHSPTGSSSSHGSHSSHLQARVDHPYGAGAIYPQDDSTPMQPAFPSHRSSPAPEVRSTANLLANDEWGQGIRHDRDDTGYSQSSFATAHSALPSSSSPPPSLPSQNQPQYQPRKSSLKTVPNALTPGGRRE
ncbi:hypothetical protein BDN72DRAFT_844792 [Pluteus cervinus]|uniref:Uncharacterized protein n=1 Tax=Pluteus cervinus TaxID=181527 RepID=A0ACD3AKN0_9AGAR|nr:hypothetical protein BDN72DRAFT_844792 [Pluteus cervinus]